jgi:hypothetical protein
MAREVHGRRLLLLLLQDVRCNVVVEDNVMELETIELVLELADF